MNDEISKKIRSDGDRLLTTVVGHDKEINIIYKNNKSPALSSSSSMYSSSSSLSPLLKRTSIMYYHELPLWPAGCIPGLVTTGCLHTIEAIVDTS
jgi:hypothetical protein